MKRQFLLIWMFLFVTTIGLLYSDPSSSLKPGMSRVYGNQYTQKILDSQLAAVVGTLDQNFGSSGYLSIPGGYAAGIQTLSNGNFLVVVAGNSVNSVVRQYNAEGVLQTAYGVVDLGASTDTPRATMIDEQGRIVVSGGGNSGSAGWIVRVSVDGQTLTRFATGTNWQFVGGLAQDALGRIVAVGFNGTNAQIGRYNLDGSLDETFGTLGFVVLDGNGGLPNSNHGLYSVAIDYYDDEDLRGQIYVIMLDLSSLAYFLAFSSDGVLNTETTPLAVPLLNNAAEGQYKLALDQSNNLIFAGSVAGIINVTALTASGGAVGGFNDFVSNPTINTNSFDLNAILTDSVGYIYLIGSDITTVDMAVIRLTSTGLLDNVANDPTGNFNETGYKFFNIGTVSITASLLQAAALAPDGQLYTVGYEIDSDTSTPYTCRLNNTPYVYQIPQFPQAQEQGTLDEEFGAGTRQAYVGVTTPFNGQYGSSLMQQAQDVIEIITTDTGLPSIGDLLLGMNGFTNTDMSFNMMFAWLSANGDLDQTAGNSGYLTLTKDSTNFGTGSQEYLTQILQGPSGLVYVAGYSTGGSVASGAFVRAYNSFTSGDSVWKAAQTTAGYQGVGVGYQASTSMTLLFVDEGISEHGHISGYSSLGTPAAFGTGGTISATAYGLHMGPVYNGGLIDEGDNLFVAYKDYFDGYVKVAAFLPDGSGLLTSFGQGSPAGVSVDLFAGSGFPPSDIAVDNIRSCFNSNGDILVAAVNNAGTSLLFTLLSGETGNVDAEFGGGTGLLTVAVSGSTSLQLRNIIGVSDGTAVVTFYDNATDDTMYLARITLTGELDTTFNSQGSQPGILSMQIGDRVADYDARVATAALVQSTAGANQGNIVMSGYEQMFASDATPMTVRSFGAPGTTQIMSYPIIDTGVPGTFDEAFDLVADLGNGAATVVYTYPSGNVHEGYSLIGYYNGTTSKIARYDITTNVLDTTFGSGTGIYTIAGLTGISTLNIDADNRIIAGGTNAGVPWAQQISENGTSAVSFGTFPASMNSVTQILQQTSGRYIVAGSTSTPAGIVAAFKDELVSSATTLALDTTFNPLAGSSPAGGNTPASYIITGNAGIYSIALNSDDTILAVYKDTTSGFLCVAEIAADGSGLSTGFNFGVEKVTTIIPDSSEVCRVAIASTGNVVVAASGGSQTNVQLQRFTAAGGTDATWNSGGGVVTISTLGNGGVVLSDLMETTANQTIFLGYNDSLSTPQAYDTLFACRLNPSGALDSTWNPEGTGGYPNQEGILTFNTNLVTKMNGSSICIDGTIVAVGQQVAGPLGDPIVMYVYGDNYVTQSLQAPLEYSAGVVDLTIPNGSTGSWALSGTITGVPQKIAIYNNNSNGAIMIASTNLVNSYVTMLNADLSIADSATYGTNGVAMIAGKNNINDMYLTGDVNVDDLQPILVTGSTSGAMWGATISTNGDTITYIDNSSTLTTGNVIRQTSNGRILVAGFNGTHGAIAAFGSVTEEGVYPLDTTFGNNNGTVAPNDYGSGVYATGVPFEICDMAVDALDRIYIVFKVNSSTIAVQRLLANGTAVDATFGSSAFGQYSATFPGGSNYSNSQIRMYLDNQNEQLVVTAQDGQTTGNILQLARFNLADGSVAGSINTITIPSNVLNVSDVFIDEEQRMYVIGYNSTANNAIVARVVSVNDTTIQLDTANYAVDGLTRGIENTSTGGMKVALAGAYNPDRRTYLVGSNGLAAGYMARVYGDTYTSQVSEAIAVADVGALDTTLQPNNTGAINLNEQFSNSLSSNWIAYAIFQNQNNDGTSFIAFGNDTDVKVGCLDADMNPVTSFGTSGLTDAVSMNIVNNMTLDAEGNIIVVGTNTTSGVQKIVLFNSSGVLQATFAAPTVTSTLGNVVGQQKSGRYIVGGYDGSANGLIMAYKNTSAISAGILPVDNTFGPAIYNGYYPTGVNAQIEDLCIDDNDNIFFLYRVAGTVYLAKLAANGSGLSSSLNSSDVPEFGGGAPVMTNIVNVLGYDFPSIAINSDGNILVGGTDAVLGVIKVALFNGSTGEQIGSTVSFIVGASPVLTKLVGSGTGFYGAGFDATPQAIVFAITGSGGVDFNFGTAGLTTAGGADVGYPQAIYGLSVQYDGKLTAVGNLKVGGSGAVQPNLMRFFGYEYVPQFAQDPDQVAAGILDTTLWPTTGAYPLDNTSNSTFNTLVSNYVVKAVYESGNGIMTFVADSGDNSVVFQLNKDLTLNTDFYDDNGGYRSFIGIAGGTTSIFANSLGDLYGCGNNGGESWAFGLTFEGQDLFGANSSLASAYAIAEQAVGRVVLAGQGSVTTGQANTNGYILGFNNEGVLDITFGSGDGILDMGVLNPITDITIDQYDRIIAVSVDGSGNVILQRTTSSGSVVSTLTGGTVITGVVGNPKVILDDGGYIIVAAATSTGYIIRSYNNDATGTDNATAPVIITAGTTPVLSNIYATSDSRITLIGYDSATTGPTAGNAIVARLLSAGGTLVLDNNFNADDTPGYLVTSIGVLNQINDGIIHADDRIMLVGSNATVSSPYMGRVFGDVYVSYVSQAPEVGVPGTLNPSFGNTSPTNGSYDISTLNSLLVGGQGRAILPVADGGYFMAISAANGNANSILIKTVASGALDTTYNSTGIATTYAPLGVDAMLQDGSGNIVLVGTNSGTGWAQRYTPTGVLDTSFGSGGMLTIGTHAQAIVEQTLARLVIAGRNDDGDVTLFAFQSLSPDGVPGTVDTTFNSTGDVPGQFTITGNGSAPMLIADQYDRLLFAIIVGSDVNLYRLTPTGELDMTFGTGGIVTSALTNAQNAWDVRLGFNQSGDVFVACDSTTTNTFSIRSFDNGTLTVTGGNGAPLSSQLNVSGLINPNIKALISSQDGYVYCVGKQDGGNQPAWVARFTEDCTLDTTAFNPAALDAAGTPGEGIAGIFQYAASGSTLHEYYGLAVNANGTLGMLGSEVISSVQTPMLVSIYNDPYTQEQAQCQDSKPVGSNDITLGVSPDVATELGITFYGSAGADVFSGQVARAIGLYDDNNLVVAIDGNSAAGAGDSVIMMNMFDTDGLLNPNFGIGGQATVLDIYEDQHATDMVTFTTAAGVTKAIIAGYVNNSVLHRTDSLVLQYILTPGDGQGLDDSFGGYDSNPVGIAFGDGKQLYSVGRQSNGRVIAAGLSQNNLGLLLGYTTNGNLDMSFGRNGYQSTNTGTTGIYTHAIDSYDRIVFAYNDGSDNVAVARYLADGSGLDTTFTVSSMISGIDGNSNIKIAVDSSNNVYVVAVNSNGNRLAINSYNAVNGNLLNSEQYDGTYFGSEYQYATFILGRTIIDQAGNVVIATYLEGTYNKAVFVTRLTSSLAIDTTFNSGEGFISYQVAGTVDTSSQVVTHAMIHPDGRILVVGSEAEDL